MFRQRRSEPGAPPSHAYRPLAEGTLNLFRAAEAADVSRLVVVSSCSSREHRDEYSVRVAAALMHNAAQTCAQPRLGRRRYRSGRARRHTRDLPHQIPICAVSCEACTDEGKGQDPTGCNGALPIAAVVASVILAITELVGCLAAAGICGARGGHGSDPFSGGAT